MELSVITITYNSKDQIAEQIRSVVLASEGIASEQIVIDNASADGTVDCIREQFPHVRIIPNSANRGFGKANNQGIEYAAGEFLLFLNPDMRLQEAGDLKKLIEWMRAHPDVGIASVKLLRPDGMFNRDAAPRRFPKLWEMLAIVFKFPHLFPHLLDRYLMSDFDPEKEQEVDSVRGAFMVVRRELIHQLDHAFDPRYYIWFEDVDLCREAKRLGWKVVYTPMISCVDYVGHSFRQKNFWWKQKQFVKSMIQYFWKHRFNAV